MKIFVVVYIRQYKKYHRHQHTFHHHYDPYAKQNHTQHDTYSAAPKSTKKLMVMYVWTDPVEVEDHWLNERGNPQPKKGSRTPLTSVMEYVKKNCNTRRLLIVFLKNFVPMFSSPHRYSLLTVHFHIPSLYVLVAHFINGDGHMSGLRWTGVHVPIILGDQINIMEHKTLETIPPDGFHERNVHDHGFVKGVAAILKRNRKSSGPVNTNSFPLSGSRMTIYEIYTIETM